MGISGCTQDFRVRRVEVESTARTQEQDPRTPHDAGKMPALPTNTANLATRRRATEQWMDTYGAALLAAPGHTLRVPMASGRSVSLRLTRGKGPGGVEPSRFASLEPADHFAVTDVNRYSGTPGAGVPLVGALRPTLPVNVFGPAAPQPVVGFRTAVTVVATNERNSSVVVLELYDPHTTGRAVGGNGVSHSLAADYTTPLALELAQFRPQRRGLLGLLRGGEYFPDTGIYSLEKATPDKTPLVLVHGLISDPGDFRYLVNDLAGDEEVRRRYQVWVFYYPTSLPVAYAAMLLREDLEAFVHRLDPDGTHPALHHAVLVGHSMGGLLCRFAISDGGDRYYHHFFKEPVDRLRLSAADRGLVRRAFYYRACPDVARVVFVATPHHGSRLAGGLLGNVGRLLLHMPSTVQQRLRVILVRNRTALAIKDHLRPGSSLDSLTPRSPVIAAVNDLPMRPGVRLHSIVGDRGRGGPLERSSDGVVPYESSHLPQAESERVVPAGHTGTLARPETFAELIRILR